MTRSGHILMVVAMAAVAAYSGSPLREADVNAARAAGDLLAKIDHLVYATPDLNAGIDRIEQLLGVRATPGGQHPGIGTRNALIALGPSSYLEIIGPDLEQPKPERPRTFGIDDLRAPRLATWVAKGTDLEQLTRAAASHGVTLGDVIAGSRRRPDGVLLAWRFTDPRTVVADGIVPYFIDWGTSPHPSATAARGVTLAGLRAEHPDAPRVRAMLDHLGLDLPVKAGSQPALIATLDTPKGRVELGLAPAPQPAAAPRPPLVKENATVKVSDHVYVIPDESVPAVPNVGIVVGGAATLVIDTGLGPKNGQAVLREVAKVSTNARMYLVTTHFHPEHAAGSSAFPPTATFVVSRAQQKDLDELGLDMAATFAGRTTLMGELLKDVRFRRADLLFDRQHDLDLGGVRVRLLSLGPTHTRGDTIAFVEGDRVLFAGDVVMNRAFLAFGQYSSAKTWLDVLGELEGLRPRTIVPSHGPMGDASLIDQQRGVLRVLQARVRELKTQGRSVDEAAQLLTSELQASHADWTAPNRVGAAVRSIYAEER